MQCPRGSGPSPESPPWVAEGAEDLAAHEGPQTFHGVGFLDCTLRYTPWQIPCESEPEIVTLEFSNAVFCLQPEGDTPTRKSIFDSLVAECIPVVFSNHTAHLQYDAYLPTNPTLYSIVFNKDKFAQTENNIVQALASISTDRIHSMQEYIREHILPHVVSSSPTSSMSFQDAFDIALQRLISNFTPLS
ncbi:hypothetical protein L7F22_042787 [Adiantum nelumboides]|nr:hypothetical protein [Adiantum nelumboides]